MKKALLFGLFAMTIMSCVAQVNTSTFKTNVIVQKVSPAVKLIGTGAVIDFYNGDLTLTQSSDLLTLAGGNLSVGSNSILGTGSLGSTGSRFAKGWFADMEITNWPTIAGTSLQTRIFNNATFTGTLTLPTSWYIGTVLMTATASELNKLHGYTGSAAQLNYLSGTTGNIQQQLDSKISSVNTHLTGTTVVDQLQIGTSDSSIVIEGVSDVGKGLTVVKNGSPITYNFPDENIISIQDVPTVPSIHYASGDTSNYPIPGKIGDIYYDLTNNKMYFGKTAARGGWIKIN